MPLPPRPVDPAILEALGQLTVNYNKLEGVLRWFISLFLGQELEVGTIVTAQASTMQLGRVLNGLFRYQGGNSELYPQLDGLLKRLSNIQEERNKLIHSEWYFNISDGTKVTTRPRLKSRGLTVQSETRKPEEVAALAQATFDLADDFHALMLRRFWPDTLDVFERGSQGE